MYKPLAFLAVQVTLATICYGQNISREHQIFAGTGKPVRNTVAYVSGTPAGPASKLALGNPLLDVIITGTSA